MLKLMKKFVREEDGISSVEYALILALIGVAIVAAAKNLGTAVSTRLQTAADKVNTP